MRKEAPLILKTKNHSTVVLTAQGDFITKSLFSLERFPCQSQICILLVMAIKDKKTVSN